MVNATPDDESSPRDEGPLAHNERRVNKDRRVIDVGPPDGIERRKGERRRGDADPDLSTESD